MRNRTILFLVLLLTTFTAAVAQQPDGGTPMPAGPHLIEFQELTHDFGTKAQGDPCETVFKFKNISGTNVKLTNVKAACGCTTPEWSKEDIAPGAFGEIKVSYNSQRIGTYNKSVAVFYNDRQDPITIYIKGLIEPKEGSAEPNTTPPPLGKPVFAPTTTVNYTVVRGGLAFEKVVENIKNFTSEEEVEAEFKFRNTTSLPIKFLPAKTESEAGVTVQIMNETLAAGQEGSVKVRMNGKALKAAGVIDGYVAKNVAIYTDEVQLNKKELTIAGNFKRYFTEVERNSSPHVEFETLHVEGGKIIEGEKYVYDFKFKNTGKAPLKIISAKASCGCTAIKPIEETIAPGDWGAITVSFDSKGRPGMQSKSVTVATNDIETPTIGLRFTVEVVKDPFHSGGVVDQH